MGLDKVLGAGEALRGASRAKEGREPGGYAGSRGTVSVHPSGRKRQGQRSWRQSLTCVRNTNKGPGEQDGSAGR